MVVGMALADGAGGIDEIAATAGNRYFEYANLSGMSFPVGPDVLRLCACPGPVFCVLLLFR